MLKVEEVTTFQVEMPNKDKEKYEEFKELISDLIKTMDNHHCNVIICRDYEDERYVFRSELEEIKDCLISLTEYTPDTMEEWNE